MTRPEENSDFQTALYDTALDDLSRGKDAWAKISPDEAAALLSDVKTHLNDVSAQWVELASRAKGIPKGSALEGEEWLSGPYGLMATCDGYIETLSGMTDRAYVDALSTRTLANGNTAVKAVPANFWDHVIMSGITAEVWMQDGVTPGTLKSSCAGSWAIPAEKREGKVALVLGAGNISSIAPLDCFQKLFAEHQVVLLKLNPVNAYLKPVLEHMLAPLIARDALRIVTGGGAAGAYFCQHPKIDEIHITGACATHDAIVWGQGAEAEANKANGTPINTKRVTSELGAVCPTIVVPGPWSAADILFQAENIATHKLHNGGFNCLATQVLVTSDTWDQRTALIDAVKAVLRGVDRPAYYPGTNDRVQRLAETSTNATWLRRDVGEDILLAEIGEDPTPETFEVFGQALCLKSLPQIDPEAYLKAAVEYANTHLEGTLAANILIHPKTIRAIGKARLEELVSELKYGCITVNSWSAVGFLLTRTPWGAFPGHTLEDVSSGIGQVHNTYMFDRAERTVVTGSFAPFPRSFLSGAFSLLPRPPWFVTHKRATEVGRAMTSFQYQRSLWKLINLGANALRG
ncbi:MAG: aldehyde dehydrogenase family protein [Rhodobacteraceae bacterium]|nr:aldehyde dehydrogenase family protein [Paracoccaceae bacterium]